MWTRLLLGTAFFLTASCMLAYIRRMEHALQDGIDDYDDEVKQMIEEETRNLTEAIGNHEARIRNLEMLVRATLKVNIENLNAFD